MIENMATALQQTEVFDANKNNNIEIETANKLVEMYEKQVQQAAQNIKTEQVVANSIANTLLQQPQPLSQQTTTNNMIQQQQPIVQQNHQQIQPMDTTTNTTETDTTNNKDNSTENIDVTSVSVANNVAHQQHQQQLQQQLPQQLQHHQPPQQNNLNIVLNGDQNQLKPSPENVDPNAQQMGVYNREIPPPNSIYGIESLTSKPYDAEASRQLTDVMQSPRFQNGYNTIASPHHSSPDRNNHRIDQTGNWLSPGKSLPFRGLCPPTSPYVDNRDSMVQAAAHAAAAGTQAARRFMPPFYGGTNRNFTHPTTNGTADRNRYGNYPVGSPMMSTLGYPRDTTMDNRYNLHIPPALNGFGEEDKFKLSPPSLEDKHIWTKQEVELLLDLYEEHKSKLQDPRVRKTKVWDDIAKHIHEKLEADVNGCQCNQKFRNMKADYQKVVEHNARAGSFRKTCKYYDRLEKLLTPVSETDKLRCDENGMNNTGFANGFGSKAGTPNGNGFYDSSRSTTSSECDDKASRGTPSSPEKRTIDQVETTGDDSSPPPAKRPCNDCSGSVSKKDLVDVLKDFLREQRKRDEENFAKLQQLHKEKLDAVVKFLDMFQELVKKV